MDNPEILKRFDVLYNNIMSDQAPGLNAYEKSVFWNKATIEVLKNHLNPKGNKYTEGYDGSSKRQIDFSNITKIKKFYFNVDRDKDTFSLNGWRCLKTDEPVDNKLSIINEQLDILDGDVDAFKVSVSVLLQNQEVDYDFNKDGRVNNTDITELINYMLGFTNEKIKEQLSNKIKEQLEYDILYNDATSGKITFDSEYTMETIVEEVGAPAKPLIVVPINNVEYDTLMSRPYKYPPKSQAWRLFVNGQPEFIVHPGELPIRYTVRYVKYPKEVNLDSNDVIEVPEELHDEILQRAVELAKNAWEGNLETHKAFGERSE